MDVLVLGFELGGCPGSSSSKDEEPWMSWFFWFPGSFWFLLNLVDVLVLLVLLLVLGWFLAGGCPGSFC